MDGNGIKTVIRVMNIYVDLDGTLVKSDLLQEGLVCLLKQRFIYIFAMPFWLLKGKAFFKTAIFTRLNTDFSNLPFTQELLDYLQQEKSKGRKIILTTGNSIEVANAVCGQLPIFDGVIATENQNMVGNKKLETIRHHAGGEPFSYAGNSAVDHPILLASAEPILVNPSASLRKKWRSLDAFKTIESQKPGYFKLLIKSMRVHQWAKNILLFAPLFLAHKANDLEVLTSVAIGFVSFSLIASGTYLLNDLLDIPADRQHPVKRHRPFAAAELPISFGLFAIAGLLGFGALLAYMVSLEFLGMCGIYLIGTLAYSFYIKSYIILDVITLTALYIIRLFSGAVIAATSLSFWLLGFAMFVFLSLAFLKRCTELGFHGSVGNESLAGRDYRIEDLSLVRSMGVASSFVSVLVIAMYINSEDVILLYRHPQTLWVICPVVLYWLMRMWIKSNRGELHDDPVEFSIKDPVSLLCGAIVVVTLLAAI